MDNYHYPSEAHIRGVHLTPCSTSWLEKLGAFQITINGIELKGWIPDFIDGGTHTIYLDENECLQISSAFCDAARLIIQNKQNATGHASPRSACYPSELP